jgi:plasmid stabilization system protein ParE
VKRTIRIGPLAQDDLRRQAEFIAQDSLDAALRLLEAAEVTDEFLCRDAAGGVRLPIRIRSGPGSAKLENQRLSQPSDSLSSIRK